MPKHVSIENTAGLHKIELKREPEGIYIFIFECPDSTFPERDYLVDELEIAIDWCEEDFGVPRGSWLVVD